MWKSDVDELRRVDKGLFCDQDPGALGQWWIVNSEVHHRVFLSCAGPLRWRGLGRISGPARLAHRGREWISRSEQGGGNGGGEWSGTGV